MEYRVLSPVLMDTQRYEPGETIEVNGARASELLDSGSIEPMHKPFQQYKPTANINLEGE
ncbi:MAG: hypothetical protein Q8O37_11430 [Sulfuricellaceae bacterium]|nr:hypothetical protein [Sulfuricellaceae bacterium]